MSRKVTDAQGRWRGKTVSFRMSPEENALLDSYARLSGMTKQDYMMSRRETETVGETAVWEHFPVTVESIALDKPLDGEQPFNFNYKIDGGNEPGVIYYKVKELSA